jgi:PAS domain S-box-containing protein
MSDLALFRLMADHAPVMLWKAGRDALCDFFNSRWLEFTGRTMAQELGNGWAEGVHAEDFQRCMDTYMTAFVERRAFRMEYRLRRADGAYRWLLDHGVPNFDASGEFLGFIGSCVDITEMRDASEHIHRLNQELTRRVREREVLLREIHHRVKNSLQLVSSIFTLHGRLLEGPALAAMQDAQSRVQSIALVHERLHESDSLAEIDLAQYLRELAGSVVQAMGPRDRVQLEVVVEPIRLPLDQAMPCGLVVSELVTNALRHAFADGRAGRIRVVARMLERDRVEIAVQDDGVGMPPEIDLDRPTSLGLDLVATLTRQLDASLSLDLGPGSLFRFAFARAA